MVKKYVVSVERSDGSTILWGICDSALEALIEGQKMRNSKAITNRVWPNGLHFVAVRVEVVEERISI